MELRDQLFDRLFLLGRPLQLEQHVVDGKIVRHGALVVCGNGLRTGIARESHQAVFIDRLTDPLPA
jgi:hypothetical protein